MMRAGLKAAFLLLTIGVTSSMVFAASLIDCRRCRDQYGISASHQNQEDRYAERARWIRCQ